MATREEVLKVLEVVNQNNDKLDILLQWRAGLEERCKSHQRQTEEIRVTLFSNPHGLVRKVDILEQCKKSVKVWQGWLRSLLERLAEAAIISTVIWLLMMYKMH